MRKSDRTKDELVEDLEKLQNDYESLKSLYNKDRIDRQRLEETLLQSERTYRLLFENSGEAILLTNPDGSIYSANPEACRIYGRSEEEICKLGRGGMSDLNDPKLESALSERYKSGKFKGVLNQVRKDGTVFPAEIISTLFNDASGNIRTAMIVRDISEQLKFERTLQKSEAAFRSIFENSVMGISQAYPGGGLIRINQAYAEMYGYHDITTMLKEIKGSPIKLYANPSDRDKVMGILDKKGSMPPTEFELIRSSGEHFWALVAAKHVKDDNGKLLYIQAEHIDITVLKETEIKLKESQKKYRNLSRRFEDILEKERSSIAMNLHDDLGQKLTALDLDLAWVRGRIGVQSPMVKKKLTEMSLMINDIVDSIKKISSLLRPSILFDLGLFPAISSLLINFEKTSGIQCQFSSGAKEINVDDRISLIIYRVLQEALTNIARHSGATIAGLSISMSQNKIEMLITDNGRGIDNNKINSITSFGITGIKKRVKAANGSVQIKGKPDLGTMIKVSIPLNQPDND